jgi:hypothetical protein
VTVLSRFIQRERSTFRTHALKAKILKVSRAGFKAAAEYGIFLGSFRTAEQPMTIRLETTLLVIGLAAIAAPASAQWPAYRAANVPRNVDGTVNTTAPAPRAADGKPDLSGLWEIYLSSIAAPPPPGQASPSRSLQDVADGADNQLGLAPNTPPPDPNAPPRATFFDIGANIEGGPPFQDWARDLRAQRMADNQKDNPDANCLPMGFMQLHLHPQPRKIVQTPELIVIMYEGNQGLRQIFMDGRELPEVDENLQPWWYGYSVGRWEGDALVVESVGFRDGGWLDVYGSPLTDQGKLIERWRRPDYGHLEIDVTVDDPKAYTRPFTVRVSHQLTVDQELIEFICNENEKSSQHYDP